MLFMLKRKIETELERFLHDAKKSALLITGARQVGKTYSIREFGKKNFDSFVEFNFIKDKTARSIFENAQDEKDVLFRLSAVADRRLIPGKTLIFLDEIQKCPEAVTYIKFLVDEGSYRYILSGSLLGVELKNVRSIPVGYMREVEMYPLDFEEFLTANGLNEDVFAHLRSCFADRKSPDEVVHDRIMRYFRLYLVIGGMPAAVQQYLDTNDLKVVTDEQSKIVVEYKRDITQYDERLKMKLRRIYSLMPSELNKQNKRFYLKNVTARGSLDRIEDDFIWLKEAGVAIPTYNVDEPVVPLELATKANLFKLFMNDVGLLAYLYMGGIQLKILDDDLQINYGSVYENFVAQELLAHGFGKEGSLHYYNSKRIGEVDFIIEMDGKVLPIEAKSGSDFKSHTALDKLMRTNEYGIRESWVFNKFAKVWSEDGITYFPIYFLMFMQHADLPERMIYKVRG